MKCCIVRKVPCRLPGTTRLVWGIILAEREGLSLIFVQKPDDQRSHAIVIGTENPAERIFEDVSVCRFPLETEDLQTIGNTLTALGEGLHEDAFEKFLKSEGLL